MFAIYFADCQATIDTLRYVQKTLTDTDFIDDDIEACEREMDSRFRATVERITVHNDGRLMFTFTNGSEETVMM